MLLRCVFWVTGSDKSAFEAENLVSAKAKQGVWRMPKSCIVLEILTLGRIDKPKVLWAGLIVFMALFVRAVPAQDLDVLKTGVVKVIADRRVGTGFVVHIEADSAYIVTASHVVEGSREIAVEFFTR